MEIDSIKSSYARWAPIYDRTFGAVTSVGRREAVGYINTQSAKSVLEVGVGTGLALPLYRADISVTGIDYSEEMLGKARAKVEKRGLHETRTLAQMDARNLEFPDDTFDFVTAMHIVSVVPEPERVMAEMARVCKPGGQIVITNHFARDTGFLRNVERFFAPFSELLGWHSDFEISTVLGQSNLRVVEQRQLPPMGMMTFLALKKVEA